MKVLRCVLQVNALASLALLPGEVVANSTMHEQIKYVIDQQAAQSGKLLLVLTLCLQQAPPAS